MPGIDEVPEDFQLDLQHLASNVVSAEAAYVQAEHGRRAMIFAARKYELEVSRRQEKVGAARLAFDSLFHEAQLLFGSSLDSHGQICGTALIPSTETHSI